jgi:hypothetical protein
VGGGHARDSLLQLWEAAMRATDSCTDAGKAVGRGVSRRELKRSVASHSGEKCPDRRPCLFDQEVARMAASHNAKQQSPAWRPTTALG